jgi:ABC-type branched-subunit amino acid transport system substrate-binding protein
MKRRPVMIAGLAAAALGLAACSSSSSSTTSGSAASGSAASGSATSGSAASASNPIKIFVYGQITGQAFALPQVVTGAQAAVNNINASGGVNGRKLQLISCDNAGNVDKDVACAQEAVSDNVAAAVGVITLTQQQSVPIIAAAHIPVIAAADTGPVFRQSPESFPVLSAPPIYAGQAAALLAKRECKHPAILAITTPDATGASKSFAKYIKLHDPSASPTKTVTVATGSVDVSAQVAQVLSGGTDCLGTALDPTTQAETFTAVAKSGQNTLISANSTDVSIPLLKGLGAEASNIVISSPYYLSSTDTPQMAQYYAGMNGVDPKATIDAIAEGAYDGVEIFALAAKGLSTVDGATVTAALGKMSDINTGLSAPLDFSQPNSLSCMPRVFNTQEFAYGYSNGAYTLLSKTPYQVGSVLGCY